ncbi:putative uncharacterized protein DDB_G0290989 [Dysidea avara]|uniref:putative uncharacterized protein DDB_G0290989 n=1 Tax=Dysidea avara TaxID=196820 RepID=UPI003325A3C7
MDHDTTFTIDQERKYARRYEEGFDLPDPQYEAWLKVNHPEHFRPEDDGDGESTDQLGNDVPSDALSSMDCDTTFTIDQERKYARRYEEGFDLPDAQYEAWLKVNHPDHLRGTAQQDTSGGNTPTSHRNSGACSTQSAAILTANGAQRSPLMELLNVPVAKTSRPKTMNTGKARVLTSAECLKALQEKENEKKRKAEEKEQRKQERLMKKQLKEEQLKRKKEEKAQQAALREAKRLEKQTKQPRQRKQRRRNTHVDDEAGSVTQNVLTDGSTLISEQVSNDAASDHHSPNTAEDNTGRGTSKRKPSSQIQSVVKRARNNADDEIDVDRSCVCFGHFADDAGTGRKWLMCCCTRWIHEDCIDNEDVDIEKCVFCPLC